MIVADDQGYADFTHLGVHDFIKMPNLDRLVAEGAWCTDAYATSPICNPSRCGIITGQYQQRWGTYWYGGSGLPENVPYRHEGEVREKGALNHCPYQLNRHRQGTSPVKI
ncbi:sulfatase-like hydrolase/transferase [Pontiella sulfatireligans]|uniref:sulfatase-like hydrolase/transferase n=1 Tax=Pontiella sulfatireligans TaxID=2750658 RepID=UPI001C9E88EF|nr:sulfatase-like hydrolase/transferase [Pontiella sulfatireligans]